MDSVAPFAGLLLGQPTLRRRIKLGAFAALDQRIAPGGAQLQGQLLHPGPLRDPLPHTGRAGSGLRRRSNNARMIGVLAFIDAAVIAYTRYDAPQRPTCTEIMSWVAQGRLPAATSVLVIEEVWHLEYRGRPALPKGTAALAAELFPVLLSVTPEHLRTALANDSPGLGTADRLHAAVALEAGCDVIVTTDRAFDELAGLRRVDPLDTAALTALVNHRGR